MSCFSYQLIRGPKKVSVLFSKSKGQTHSHESSKSSWGGGNLAGSPRLVKREGGRHKAKCWKQLPFKPLFSR
jgi:hypothetical protein